MRSLTISLIAFVIIFGGALVGMFLRSVLPSHHLRDDSRDVVKLATGMVGTMAALVLGLLVASAKGSFDAQNTEMIQTSADFVVLDRALAYYGSETKEAREALHSTAVALLNQAWSKGDSRSDPSSTAGLILYGKIRALYPRDEVQHSIREYRTEAMVNVRAGDNVCFETFAGHNDFLADGYICYLGSARRSQRNPHCYDVDLSPIGFWGDLSDLRNV